MITHEIAAEYLGIERNEAKKEHLKFFNRRIKSMKKKKLWRYYSQQEPDMMQRINEEKRRFGHKATSKKLFKEEVDLMTAIVEILNKEGIYLGYVYDALICHPKHKERVLQVMNEVARERGILTKAEEQ